MSSESADSKLALISFKNVDKVYPNGFKALDNISLDIYAHEFVAIIGLSGAGKSTLLRSINRMHPVSGGSLEVLGYDIMNIPNAKLRLLRRSVGMVFQSFNLVKRSSVFANVLNGRVAYHPTWRMLLGLFTQEDKMIALQALDKLGILEKTFERADKLSGGQMQRVALARALAQDAKIILADEPVASLDPITTIDVMKDFQRINRELGITIIANMHHVDLAFEYATRVIGLNAGKVVFDGPPKNVTESVIQKIYGRSLTEKEKFKNER
jgi:phosphonate transport system ATP-binding protein